MDEIDENVQNANELAKDFEVEVTNQNALAVRNNQKIDSTNERMVELDGRMNKLIAASN